MKKIIFIISLLSLNSHLYADKLGNLSSNSDVLLSTQATGGSQTPWTSDIDGANHALLNVSTMTYLYDTNDFDASYGQTSAVGGPLYGYFQPMLKMSVYDFYSKPFAGANFNQYYLSGDFPWLTSYMSGSIKSSLVYGQAYPGWGIDTWAWNGSYFAQNRKITFSDAGEIVATSSITGTAFYGDISHATGGGGGPFTQAVATTTLSMPFGLTASTVTASTLTVTGLTAGRVPYVGTAGLVSDDAELIFNTTINSLLVGSSSLGTEILTNGTFTGGYSPWTKSASFSYSSNAMNYSGTSGSVYEQFNLPAGYYYASYVITNYTGTARHYMNVFTGSVNVYSAYATGDGTFSMYFLSPGTNVTFYIRVDNGTSDLTLDTISFKKIGVASDVNSSIIAPHVFQNGYPVIDSSNIGSQTVAVANNATTATNATNADNATTATTALSANGGNTPFTFHDATAGDANYIDTDDSTYGMIFGLYSQPSSAGPNPTFKMDVNFTTYTGPIYTSFLMGDIQGSWSTGRNPASIDYNSDSEMLTLASNGGIAFTNFGYGGNAGSSLCYSNAWNGITYVNVICQCGNCP